MELSAVQQQDQSVLIPLISIQNEVPSVENQQTNQTVAPEEIPSKKPKKSRKKSNKSGVYIKGCKTYFGNKDKVSVKDSSNNCDVSLDYQCSSCLRGEGCCLAPFLPTDKEEWIRLDEKYKIIDKQQEVYLSKKNSKYDKYDVCVHGMECIWALIELQEPTLKSSINYLAALLKLQKWKGETKSPRLFKVLNSRFQKTGSKEQKISYLEKTKQYEVVDYNEILAEQSREGVMEPDLDDEEEEEQEKKTKRRKSTSKEELQEKEKEAENILRESGGLQ